MRFATDDRVTVTDPKHWNYGEQGIVQDYALALFCSTPIYEVELDGRDFTVMLSADQLDFTNTEEGEEK